MTLITNEDSGGIAAINIKYLSKAAMREILLFILESPMDTAEDAKRIVYEARMKAVDAIQDTLEDKGMVG